MPTLKEVALRAEVSTATVSKVLSNTPYVSDETRSRVLKAVEELGYVPNLAARALSKGRTYIIGVIFPYRYDQMFGDPHMLTILEGIETVCAQRDYSMLLSTPKIPVTESEQYQRLIRSGYLDGVIAMETVASSPVSNPLNYYGYPWVAIGYHSAVGTANIIHSDDFAGAKAAAEHLIKLGHRHIGIISVDEPSPSAADRRLAGYRLAFMNAKLDFDAAPTEIGNYSVESGYQMAGILLSRPDRPTAILCLNDRMAMGAVQRAESMGLHVPSEVSIIGFDDIPTAAYFTPPLTTVRQPAHQIGVRAAEILFHQIEAPKRPGQTYQTGLGEIVFPAELIVRGSTAPVTAIRDTPVLVQPAATVEPTVRPTNSTQRG